MRAIVFPGQGSQKIGMGKSLYDSFPAAKQTFQEVDDALGLKLSALMFDGSEEDLKLTQNAQPALMAVSMAVVNVLTKDMGMDLKGKCQFIAGHSLGEYSAYCAGGSFSLSQTAKLLLTRGLAMQQAVPQGVGGMAALLGAELDQAEELVTKASAGPDSLCEVANDNAPGQIVISGHLSALERATTIAQEMGIKRVIPLPVSAPFHCSLMQAAADKMSQALADHPPLGMPSIQLLPNTLANLLTTADDITPQLIAQVTGRVRWRETVLKLAELGVSEIIELGSGKVLSGLTKRIAGDITSLSAETPEELDLLAKHLS